MGFTTIGIEHEFEAAHRLPFLGGKCMNLHGHTWKVRINIANFNTEAGVDSNGLCVDFAQVKSLLRGFIDGRLDHGTMLGVEDELADVLPNYSKKVFIFGEHWEGAKWPTVESVAHMIADSSQQLLTGEFGSKVCVDSVWLRETRANYVTYTPDVEG